MVIPRYDPYDPYRGDSYEYRDAFGSPLKTGDIVVVGVAPNRWDPMPAKIITIFPPDGDVDDDTGQTVMVPPSILVEFRTEERENFCCHWLGESEWAWCCDDIRKVRKEAWDI